ncbi:GroES-like protein [Paraphysoderma sedebokerense]|nr:GroES-like protein [Paraphysoderma sedebokerense]
MKALKYHSSQNVMVEETAKPMITHPKDAIVKIHMTTICGSDLHLYHHQIPQIEKGDIIGHEAMGLVESVGNDVTKFKVGDRVVISAVIACGECRYCQMKAFSCCDNTNSSGLQEKLYGHKTSGLFGYSHTVGGYPGLQAEYARIPNADLNLLHIPDSLTDEIAVLLSDVLCTSWHGCELGEVKEGDNVAVWGAGPIGMMIARWAKYRGANRVILIDRIADRLNRAKEAIPGLEAINYDEKDVLKYLKESFDGDGPDVCIEAAGFRYTKSWTHTIETTLKLETDSIDALSECIYAVRKTGRVVLIGDFMGYANQFPVGAMMEKSLTVRGGQLFCQKYWEHLRDIVLRGEVDPSFLITHQYPFSKAADAYKIFDAKADHSVKMVLRTAAGMKEGKVMNKRATKIEE